MSGLDFWLYGGYTGCREITSTMENHMQKEMEHEVASGMIKGFRFGVHPPSPTGTSSRMNGIT